jgi:hypothetical protein
MFLRADTERYGRLLEEVAYVVCAYAVHKDPYLHWSVHPNTKIENMPPTFVSLLQELLETPRITMKTIRSRYSALQQSERVSDSATKLRKPVNVKPNGAIETMDKYEITDRTLQPSDWIN